MDTLEQTLKENIAYYRLQEQQALATLTGLPRGSIKKKVTRGRTYYYRQHRSGGKVVQHYLGRTYPEELAHQIEKRKAVRAQLREIRRALKLLRQTSSDDLLGPVKELLAALARTGLWEAGAEVVGSWCFRIYQVYLGVSPYPLRTDDLDVLIPIPWPGPPVDLSELLRGLGFSEQIAPDGSTAYHRPGIRVEFLSSGRGRSADAARAARGLGVRSQALRFMDLLLDNPVRIKIMAGVYVTVPAPSAFLLHKLLISTRRKAQHKRVKDTAQAIAVARYLMTGAEQRQALMSTWQGLLPSWRDRVLKAIRQAMALHPMEEGVLAGLRDLLVGCHTEIPKTSR
jgi:hypothetical protein